MATIISQLKMTDHSVIRACLLGSRPHGTGLSGVVLGGNERPTKAPEVAAQAQAVAFAGGSAANGAGEGRQKTQRYTMWAFRGLRPWRDPA
ncbi:hypothetical protein ACH4RA_05540 [Streptomyces smyrnaeus]|uniref:hypothetical protein n=1 Tax=Streptomyces TaxID=1883 RepID=UPI000C1874EB|nr:MULTISPECIES: hypothetical protein [unclassified Streptomyces]MBQ0867934.1 hypothetical protein [Streptomyces sp. RK75]MBQ1124746.1 hypothetical protein [Streptomyces sp. B15]MBQ1162632.1 hypothetical protein [Streptomyces sp. A73]